MSIINRLNTFESQLREVGSQTRADALALTTLRGEVEQQKEQLTTKLEGALKEIQRLRIDVDELKILLDATVEAQDTDTADTAEVTPKQASLKNQMFHSAEGELLIPVGPGVKDAVEADGYQVVGTKSTDGLVYFKLRF